MLHPAGLDRALQRGPQDFLDQAVVGPQKDGTYVVPTSQVVAPAGETILFPGRPVGIAIHPKLDLIALKNKADVVFLSTSERKIIQTLALPKQGNSHCGIQWTGDGTTLWTTSAEDFLYGAARNDDGAYEWKYTVKLPGPKGKDNPAPGGFALDESKGIAYVTLSRNNTVAVVDLAKNEVTAEIPVGIAPYDVRLVGDKAYVTNWGGRQPREGDLTGPTSGSRAVIDERGIASTGTVSVIDLNAKAVTKEIAVDLHPCGMALSPDQAILYVANANSDTISLINTRSDAVTDRWVAKPMRTLPFGSAPNALELSPDGATLYVALGGNNCIAVMDAADGSLKGLIPTGWYPGDVRLTDDGLLCIANTKGVGSLHPDTMVERKEEAYGKDWYGHNTHDHMGSVTLVDVPDKAQLADLTYQSACDMRLPTMHQVMNLEPAEKRAVPVPTRPGEVSRFKHVVYIIKENRTYDQVFGDMPQGKGDPGLCQFGKDVTPNHHAMAEEFVLLDNFYCNGVLSADGHQWTDEGYVTDYIEKAFGGFPRSYPYEGDDALAYASSGFIWDHVLAKGLTFRNYGEMVKAVIKPGDATWADIYKDYLDGTRTVEITARTEVKGLEPYLCPTFVGFPGKVQDVYRAEQFLKEFRQCEETGEWYNFTIMLLPNDHTVGTREGYPTPRATVADNDLALGRIVDAISHSKFWPETVIFVVEDDPQAGLDHIDGHRTVALCVSPYTRRGYVDSTHYTQTGMIRTMELIMGLEPLNQLTMAATPMTASFKEVPDLTPYKHRENIIPLDEMNAKVASLTGLARHYAEKSMEMPLDDIDQADEDLFNRVIWHSVKGYDVPYPKLARRPHLELDDDE
ncbi:MAG: bifunctional YncE family protein/alkaline phosphatase family protein [bacterium]|nr:bifunctional YncE family protein/alkaline phosphatase family protein [bacterium]